MNQNDMIWVETDIILVHDGKEKSTGTGAVTTLTNTRKPTPGTE
jgi:hypothetical protein